MITKSRVERALELAGITATPAIGTCDSESLALSLMVHGRHHVALANVLLHLVDKEQAYEAADDTGKPLALSVPYSDPYAAYAECQRLQGIIDGMREGMPARDAEMQRRYRDKYHSARREVRRLNARLRLENLSDSNRNAGEFALRVAAERSRDARTERVRELESDLGKLAGHWQTKVERKQVAHEVTRGHLQATALELETFIKLKESYEAR